jgi:hypothetical protein
MGVGLAAAQHRQRDLGTDRAAEQALALVQGHVPGRLAVDGAYVIAGVQSSGGSRGAVARCHDPEVVLPGERQAGAAGRTGGVALERLHLRRIQVRAVRVEPFRQAEHRAVQDLVGVGFLDIAAEDQRHDVIEDAQVRVRAGCGPLLPEQAPHHGEQHERCRERQDENACATGHQQALVIRLRSFQP